MPIEPVIETIQDDLFGGSAAYVPARPARKPAAARRRAPVQMALLTEVTLTETVDVAAMEIF